MAVTRDEFNRLFAEARKERAPLLIELKSLNHTQAVERLMKEPLLDRLYWYATLLHGPKPHAERKRLHQEASPEEVERANECVSRICRSAAHAAKRYYGYSGHEPADWVSNVSRMFEELADCPPRLATHAYEHALLMLR
jgi:hypothetical protein